VGKRNLRVAKEIDAPAVKRGIEQGNADGRRQRDLAVAKTDGSR